MHFKTETIVGIFILIATAVFLYMSFQLGSLRLDVAQYARYTIFFKDVSGLMPKADVKISGVKVGWVDSVHLEKDNTVKLDIRISKECTVHEDATGIIRQEGLLGAKFLELLPGSHEAPIINAGGTLPLQARQLVSIDELFYTFQKIASTVESMGASSKEISTQAREFIADLHKSLALVNTLLVRLSQSAECCCESVTTTTQSLKEVASNINAALASAQKPVKHIGELAQKLQEGEGSLGKMIADPCVYEDIKYTTQFARSCLQRARGLAAAIDTHLEILPIKDCKTNVKGYFDVWLYPRPDLLCLIGPVYSHLGFAKRTEFLCDGKCKTHVEEKRDSFRLNLQVGACLPCRFILRGGLFQGTAGFGVDWILPFERFGWMTTFEAFDFRGHTRFGCDKRPYLKWLNRLFFTENVYLTFGANDFISRHYKSGFIGLGVAFSSCGCWPCPRC